MLHWFQIKTSTTNQRHDKQPHKNRHHSVCALHTLIPFFLVHAQRAAPLRYTTYGFKPRPHRHFILTLRGNYTDCKFTTYIFLGPNWRPPLPYLVGALASMGNGCLDYLSFFCLQAKVATKHQRTARFMACDKTWTLCVCVCFRAGLYYKPCLVDRGGSQHPPLYSFSDIPTDTHTHIFFEPMRSMVWCE